MNLQPQKSSTTLWIKVHLTLPTWFPAPLSTDATPGGLAAQLYYQKGLFQSRNTLVLHKHVSTGLLCNTLLKLPCCSNRPSACADAEPDASYFPKIACASAYSSCRNFSNPLLAIQQHYIADYKGNHLSKSSQQWGVVLFWYKKMFVMGFI